MIQAFEEYFGTAEIKFDSQQAVFSGFCKFKENGSRSVAASMERKPLMIPFSLSVSLSRPCSEKSKKVYSFLMPETSRKNLHLTTFKRYDQMYPVPFLILTAVLAYNHINTNDVN